MKKITININYHTRLGEFLVLEIGNQNESKWNFKQSEIMTYNFESNWSITIELPVKQTKITFRFLLKNEHTILREEYGKPHTFSLPKGDCVINCYWQDKPAQKYFNTSFFYNSIFKHPVQKSHLLTSSIQMVVDCVHIEQSQELIICGEGEVLGNWLPEKGLTFTPVEYRKWSLNLSREQVEQISRFKFVIRDKKSKQLVEWEDGSNRNLEKEKRIKELCIIELSYNKEKIEWRGSGVVIPIFSLRSEKSMGIGEFTDLKPMIDWAAQTKMRVIQTLPINDTTVSYSWLDSYPYNAISIYALHPIYLGMDNFVLKDKAKQKAYIKEGAGLNKLPAIDYDKVIKLKTNFQKDLFKEIGQETIASDEFKAFFKKNEEWLFPYACFCYFRDKYHTANFVEWREYSFYDKAFLEKMIASDKAMKDAVNQVYFVQYLLHKQLKEAKEYAYSKGVTLKGDIPIGISPNSVEAWTEPHLFNIDCQTGAPPDDFSIDGQNWGFPTYNWTEMAKDGFSWWRKRFIKMTDYFDAYRIDHILGFFRIWEISANCVNGLLGYFSPALPLSAKEIRDWGFPFCESEDTLPQIHKENVKQVFGIYAEDAINQYLLWKENDYFTLNRQVDTQKKIQAIFEKLPQTSKNKQIRDGLYRISGEVLFIQDKYETAKYHPRISLQNTFRYTRLNAELKSKIDNLYINYFYHRHTEFWRQEAMSKLPSLINSTDMLVCGEDLGMIPDSVHSVMNELEILSLEIQRMPKQAGLKFSFLNQAPYLSVVTTSTHDMSPIRMWWEEDKQLTQEYFETRLKLSGKAPDNCNTIISTEILKAHLHSPAMLTIFPLQDWLSVSDKLRRKNPKEERINIPADPKHNWNYRMHLTLEELLKEEEFSALISFMNEEAGR